MKRDIDFIFEMGTIRHIQRTWRQFLNPDFQNLAEHHFRVMWLALLLAKMEKVKDTGKILKLAIVHDIAESRTGDVNYLQRQYVERFEEQAINDMLNDTLLAAEFLPLWEEYQARKSIESQIVKDADNLDVDFEVKEQQARGHKFGPEWAKMRLHVGKTQLFTRSAKKMWLELEKAKPHDWHQKGRNRFYAGDWQKNKKPTN